MHCRGVSIHSLNVTLFTHHYQLFRVPRGTSVTIRWEKDGAFIDSDTVTNNLLLHVIPRVDQVNAGHYTCSATIQGNATTSTLGPVSAGFLNILGK